jgi:hypothetical protein
VLALSVLFRFFADKILVDSLTHKAVEDRIACSRACFLYAFAVPSVAVKVFSTFGTSVSSSLSDLLLLLCIFELSALLNNNFPLLGKIQLVIDDASQFDLTFGSSHLVKVIDAADPQLPNRKISVSSLTVTWSPTVPISDSFAYGICSISARRKRENA